MKRVISDNDLKNLLEEKFLEYNTPHFIDSDPVQIPHRFTEKNDIEISAFLTSIISWGNRKMIINNADKMMKIMGDSPYDFVINASEKKINWLEEYAQIEGLKKQFFKTNILMEKQYSDYMLIK